MKLPNWFRIAWWLLLLLSTTGLFVTRYSTFISVNPSPLDIIILIVVIILWLLPLASEVTFLGFSLKKEIDNLKKEVNSQLTLLRTDIRNTVDVHTHISQQLLTTPVPDNRLPEIEEQVQAAVDAAIHRYDLRPEQRPMDEIPIDDNTKFLFQARYSIEREIRRIWAERYPGDQGRRYTSITGITRMLANQEIIDTALANAIIEVYRVCSPAIHGEKVSEAQIHFVQDVASNLIRTLRSI